MAFCKAKKQSRTKASIVAVQTREPTHAPLGLYYVLYLYAKEETEFKFTAFLFFFKMGFLKTWTSEEVNIIYSFDL